MKRLLALAAIFLLAHTSNAEKRTIACKTPAIAASCYQTHGRLAVYNGGAPNFRLWQIGTGHLLGIFNDEDDKRCVRGLSTCKHNQSDQEFESLHLPADLQRAYGDSNPFDITIYADFEVCPLERHIPGHMQAACIESATHLVVKKN
jgi:hypothetical protein